MVGSGARALRRTLALMLATAAMLLVTASLAGAGRTTWTLSVPDGTYAGTSTATLSPSSSDATPPAETWIKAWCYQNDALVAYQALRLDGSSVDLQLGPTRAWTGGAADCVATVGSYDSRWRWKPLATTEFHVAA